MVLLMLGLVACSNDMSIKTETVSLLDYTTPSELAKLGYTPDKVDEINRTMSDYFGYKRYDGYQKYKINIVNPLRI